MIWMIAAEKFKTDWKKTQRRFQTGVKLYCNKALWRRDVWRTFLLEYTLTLTFLRSFVLTY